MKRLEDMSLEELWQLFPIELVAYRPEWAEQARYEMGSLSNLLETLSPKINHIGSTAVPGLTAKPIIDILVEVPDGADFESLRDRMIAAGYICMSVAESRMSFNKGYTPDGYAERVFHIHIHREGDRDEILFRDYLRSHQETAREYEELKLSLLPAHRHNRDGYTEAKTAFVKRITSLAKKQEQQS